jgi:hypothetical protein
MNTLTTTELGEATAENINVTKDALKIDLSDGRSIEARPLHGILACSTPRQRNAPAGA